MFARLIFEPSRSWDSVCYSFGCGLHPSLASAILFLTRLV